jgi:hypothetical protein
MTRLKLGGVLMLALLAVAAVTAQEPTSGNVELGYSGVVRSSGPGPAVTLRDVRVVVSGVVIEAEAADLSRADGGLRLALRGGGTITLPERGRIRLVGRDGAKPLYDPMLAILLR